MSILCHLADFSYDFEFKRVDNRTPFVCRVSIFRLCFKMHLGQKFHSQKEFEEAKSKYEADLVVPYTVFNSYKRELYNKKNVGKSQVPEGFLWKEAVIACKHYGNPRYHKHVAGTKKRSNQRFVYWNFKCHYECMFSAMTH